MGSRHPRRHKRLEADGIQPYNATVYQVVGNSMIKTLPEGSRILVDKGKTTPLVNCMFVFDHPGYLIVERFKQAGHDVWWSCNNPAYDAIVHERRSRCAGKCAEACGGSTTTGTRADSFLAGSGAGETVRRPGQGAA